MNLKTNQHTQNLLNISTKLTNTYQNLPLDAIACRILTTSSLETSLFSTSFSSLVSLKNKAQLQNSIRKNSQTEKQAQ
jgi:hypothetical protein